MAGSRRAEILLCLAASALVGAGSALMYFGGILLYGLLRRETVWRH